MLQRMIPLILVGLGLLGTWKSLSAEDKSPMTPAKETENKPLPVAIQLSNGSQVYMSLLQDFVEIETDYGRLKIPAKEIRYVEFGLHLEEETEKSIRKAVELLKDSSYKAREKALKQLIDLGGQAYPFLKKASKSKEEDVAKRAEKGMEAIEYKVPVKLLNRPREDKIGTTKFVVVGKIVTPAFRIQGEYFGEVSLKPKQMFFLRCLQGSAITNHTIDATKYGSVPAKWMDTGKFVQKQMYLKIEASGKVDLNPQSPGEYLCGPNGYQEEALQLWPGMQALTRVDSTYLQVPGALIAKIGENGTPFYVGKYHRQLPHQEGNLYFQIVLSDVSGSSLGVYHVKVFTGRFAE